MRCILCTTLLAALPALVFFGAAPAWSQTSTPEVNQLRQQIDVLQRQLQKLEVNTDTNSRVTQLGAKRPAARDPELIVRIYDLSDLFAMAPPCPAQYSGELSGDERPVFPYSSNLIKSSTSGAGFGGGGAGGFFSVPTAGGESGGGSGGKPTGAAGTDSRASMDDLISAITSTVAPTSWDEVGGPGSIARMCTSLLVSTDRSTHDQIEDLLTLFRKKWGTLRTVSVRASWLWLNDEQLDRLLPGDGVQQVDDTKAYGIVNETAWKKVLAEQPQAGGDQRGGYRAIITCYNGQTVSSVSGAQSLTVTQLDPVIAKDSGPDKKEHVAYRPVLSVIHEGAALQITPLANTSGKFVVADIHSRVNKLREGAADGRQANPKQLPAEDAAADRVAAAIDRPRLMTSELATTMRAPVDRTVLVGGMTFESNPHPGEPNLYLFIRLSVQELRDDLPPAKPAAGAAGEADSKPPVKAAEVEPKVKE